MKKLKFFYLNLLQGAILLFSSSGKLSTVKKSSCISNLAVTVRKKLGF